MGGRQARPAHGQPRPPDLRRRSPALLLSVPPASRVSGLLRPGLPLQAPRPRSGGLGLFVGC
ncbi:hypothetical protein U9M48_018828 [Paspalum notatum var. saurae]|uniref:Uncharacterized protein n=1 Tax=Paspalum notatum var. saurae TaxID=547442 RepID=A0AAQ3WQU2_PASNO